MSEQLTSSPPPLARPTAASSRRVYALPSFLSYFYIYFINNFRQTNYLNIYPTDLRQIRKFGRTVMQMISLKLVFFDASRDVAMVIHRTEFLSSGDIHQMAVSIREK